MPRLLVQLIDGPLNGYFVSTQDDVEAITGMQIDGKSMVHDEEGNYTDRYVKDASTLRDMESVERKLADLSFADHDLQSYCEFKYADS